MKIQSFVNRCLRVKSDIGIWWPNKISNEDLWKKTLQEPVELRLKKESRGGLYILEGKPPMTLQDKFFHGPNKENKKEEYMEKNNTGRQKAKE